MSLNPFTPVTAGTLTASATTSSSSVTLTIINQAVRCYNAGSVPVFVRFTKGASTAVVATDMPLAPGVVEVFNVGISDTISVITGSSTATVYFTSGEGL